MIRNLLPLACLAAMAAFARPAAADDMLNGRNVMIGTGLQAIPAYPGAGHGTITFLPLIDTWKNGAAMTVESPDEAFGFAVIGHRNHGFAAGPALTVSPTRKADPVAGLSRIGFGVEAGAFAEVWPAGPLRLRAELRHGIGGHSALAGDLAADLVWREGKEGPILTVGPRLRWGSAKHNRTYFGVPQAGAGPLPSYEIGSGVHALGATAGLRLPVSRIFGLYSYLGYDRLVGAAARSPIVKAGSSDQFSAGLALTYRFRL